MSQIKQPRTTVNKLSASLPVGLESQKLLIIGQKAASGTAVEKTLYANIEEGDISDKVGLGSALGVTLKAVFEEFSQTGSPNLPRVDMIALEDSGTAVKASAEVAFSASGGDDTINKSGTIEFNVMGETIELDVVEGQSISGVIAPAFETAVNALAQPVTASNVASAVGLEANNGGTIFNNATLKIDGLAKDGSNYFFSNMQVALTPFASGANDPVVTNLLDIVTKIRYQSMSYPYEYGTALATDFLDPRFNVDNAIKDGIAILKITDAEADIKTVLDALNSQSLILLCNQETTEDNFDGGEDLELDFVSAARVAAIRALRLTEECNLANILPAASKGANDAFGGKHIASLPYFNTPISGSPLQPEGKGWTDTDIEELFAKGGSVVGNNVAGNAVIMGEMVTTYKTDAAGNVDLTWRFVNTVDTMSVCAEYIFNNLKADFTQTRLTQGQLVRGYSMTNEADFISKMQEYYLALAAVALVPKSQEAMDFFITNLTTVVNTVSGTITATGKWPIVVQLRNLLVSLNTDFGQTLV